jgi:DNA replication factor GINS
VQSFAVEMSPPVEAMTVEDLSSIYRVEKKVACLSEVRRDMYKAMANLVDSVTKEHERQLGIDPDSLICEGANQRKKKVKTLARDIMDERMRKVAMLALRGSMGADNNISGLTSEERDYYNEVLASSRKHLGTMDRLRGVSKYVTPDITAQALLPAEEDAPDEEPETAPAEPEEPAHVEEAAVADGPAMPEDDGIPMEMDSEFPDEPDIEIPDDGFVPDEKEFAAAEDGPEPVAEEDVPAEEERQPCVPEEPAHVEEDLRENDNVLIRILEDLPPFSGPTCDFLLRKEDMVTMPSALAAALINREKAVAVRPTP